MELSSEELSNYYFQPNWENSMDQNEPFESALSSMVSSPSTTPAPSSNGGGDGMMIRELIGRLGSICDSADISPIATGNNSTNNSGYSTPLNSPPPSKFNLSSLMMMGNNPNHNPSHNLNHNHNYPTNLGSLNADPGFVERAAKFSCFGNFAELRGANQNNSRSGLKLESGKLSRVNSEKKMMSGGISSPENGELGDSREGSSVSEQNPGAELASKAQNDGNSRKRKPIPKAKVKETPCSSSPTKDNKVEAENEESNAKRSKVGNEDSKKENNAGESNSNKEKQNKNNNNINDAQKPEPPKDYIHVRARRGQATDSHSLAERVRREKISERMKFLQDLVPGCNKVTGKATVLDEIINYVQSLQRQVEFLSMKLATVNPRMEFNMETLLSKDSRGLSMPHTMYELDQNSAQAFPYGYPSNQQMPLPLSNGIPNAIENPFSVNPMNAAINRRNLSLPLPFVDGFTDSMTQLPSFWEDDLQSLVQMGIVQNQTQSVPGIVPNAQMKVEL